MADLARMHRNLDSIFDLYRIEVAKTADYTIVPGDNGTLFTNAGASGTVIFTLPALGPLYFFGFLCIADQTFRVASAAGDDIVWKNDASADRLSFETSGEKIGGYLQFYTNQAADKWYVRKLCEHTVTATT